MAESRAQRMKIVLLVAKRHEDEVAQRLGGLNEQLSVESAQLQALEEYQEQYLQAQGAVRAGVRVDELINYTNFIGRLGEACRDQSTKIERLQRQLGMAQQEWREKHHKRKNLEDLIARLERDETVQIDRRLQKELDELSAQQLLRNQQE